MSGEGGDALTEHVSSPELVEPCAAIGGSATPDTSADGGSGAKGGGAVGGFAEGGGGVGCSVEVSPAGPAGAGPDNAGLTAAALGTVTALSAWSAA